MKTKKSIVRTLANVLNGLKLNKLSDRKTKLTLLNDYIVLRRVVKELEEDLNGIAEKFRDDWGSELAEVTALRRDDAPIKGYDDYLRAESEGNQAISDILNEEVEVNVKPVKLEEFLAAYTDEDITLEYIAFLNDNGILE